MERRGQLFQVLILMPAKVTENIIMVSAPWWNLLNEWIKSRRWEDNRRALLQYILTCEQLARTSVHMISHMKSSSWLYSVYRVLSRIYRLGEKSRVAEGYEFPRGIRGHFSPGNFFKWICTEPEMQFVSSWATVLRNVTVCALAWSRLDFFPI